MKIKNLIKISIFIYSSIIYFSCVGNNNEYKEILPDIAKIRIVIFIEEDNHINKNDYYIEIMDEKEINIIFNYISYKTSPMYACGYNGIIEYYCKNNNLLFDAVFNTDCNTILFEYNDEKYIRRITKNGINYIENIIKEIEEKSNKKNKIGL